MEFLIAVRRIFGKQLSQSSRVEWLFWVLMVHQNLAGDMVFYVAARAGILKEAKATYYLFHGNALDIDNKWRSLDPDLGDPPVEDQDLDDLDDLDADLPSLAYLCTKNHAGCDAAIEARVAGHENLTVWLDNLV